MQLRMKSYRLLEEAIDVFLPKDLSDAEALNIRSGIFIFLHGLVSIYSRDNEECPERIKQLLTDFISFKIIEMKWVGITYGASTKFFYCLIFPSCLPIHKLKILSFGIDFA